MGTGEDAAYRLAGAAALAVAHCGLRSPGLDISFSDAVGVNRQP
jgi:hypothetical protein